MLQPIEEMIFNSNSTERYKNILRHETELKWIKSLQTPFPLGLTIIYITKETFLKCLILMYFLFWIFVGVMGDPVVNVKMVI